MRSHRVIWQLMLVLPLVLIQQGLGATLQLEIRPKYHSAPLPFDALTLTNLVGQKFSLTRLDMLVSDLAVRRSNGDWESQSNWQAFLSVREKRSTCTVDVANRVYDKLRFHIGLRPEINHSKPEQYAPDHPLNPVLNGLHWGWAGGYVFFAMEGNWQKTNSDLSGFSYHLGNDWELMTVELPIELNANSNNAVVLALDVDELFDTKMSEDNSTTHSRKGDTFADHLKSRVERAWRVISVQSAVNDSVSASSTNRPTAVAAGAHPYRFTFSSRFPMPDLPRDNPLTEEGVQLGHRLFGEKLLSINNQQSCASCHREENAFSDRERRFSRGADGQTGTRNSMPIFNLAWKKAFFWDGRAKSIRQQVAQPIENPIEMHEQLTNVVEKLKATGKRDKRSPQAPNYPEMFARAFGSPEITADKVALALEQFILTQLSYDSKFDRALEGRAELTEEEKRGFQLFVTEYDPRREQFGADCFHCHGGPLFQSQMFANNGLDSEFKDLGRYDVTKLDADKGKFSVPSLRNVELTAPYMHDGRFSTLEEVIEHYASGLKRSATLDPNLAKHPDTGIPLSAADKKALVAFLKTLTDEKFHPTTASRK